MIKHPFKSPTAWHGLEHKLDQFLHDVDPIELIVEIGVDKGYSLCHLALKYPKAGVIGVDNWSYDDGLEAKEMLDRVVPVEFPNVELWHMDSEAASVRFRDMMYVPEGFVIDVLHLDADHQYAGVKKDFELWLPMVRSGGVVLFHDIETEFRNEEGVLIGKTVGWFFEELEGKKRSIATNSGFGGWYKP